LALVFVVMMKGEGGMPKVNFENLRIYQLSEKLADRIWESVSRWDGFAKDTVGKHLVRAADTLANT